MNIKNILPILSSMGITPGMLGPDKLERLQKLSEKFTDVSQITPEVIREVTDILGINLQPKSKPVKSEKIGRNTLCKCGSGRKYKYCCITYE